MPNNQDRKLTMMDLFAGCGGLSLGFEQSGFTPIFVSELNDHARATYLQNRHHLLGNRRFAEISELHCADAKELTAEKIDEVEGIWSNTAGIYYEKRKSAEGLNSTLDVIAGGPPCQGFSGIGIRRSYSVDKKFIPSNQLYGVMAATIRRIRPRSFVFENVRGLLNAKWTAAGGERIWPDVLAEFRSIPGYTVRWSLVFAKDYGVPQNRPRVILVGLRNDVVANNDVIKCLADPEDAVKCGFLPQPTKKCYPDIKLLLGDLLDESVTAKLTSGEKIKGAFETTTYPRPPKKGTIQEELRTTPEGQLVTELTDHEYSKHAPKIVAKFTHMIENGGEVPEWAKTKKFAQRWLPPKWGAREPFITATSLPDDYVHYAQPRILSVREWARLQTFPDWYRFSGKRTTGGLRRAGNPREGIFDREVPKYTQIGNAVPVALARAISAHLRSILEAS